MRLMSRRFLACSVKTVALLLMLSVAEMSLTEMAAQQAPAVTVKTFDHAEYFHATATGQKKAMPAVKGALSLNTEKKTLEFLDKTGAAVISVNYSAIKNLLYEQTSKPRYAAAVLISPMFLLSHSKKHYLTVQYADESGTGLYLIVHLDKGNAREAIAATEAETGKTVERAQEK